MSVRQRWSVLQLSLVALLLLMNGCGTSEPTLPKAIVDLSPIIGEDLAVRAVGAKFLGEFGYSERTTFRHEIVETPFYIALSYLELSNHDGPHHDPPSHIIKGGTSTDQVPLEQFFGPAIVVDFRDKPKDQPLTEADFQGRGIRAGDIVIAFVGYTPPTDVEELPSYAYLSGEAAEYLASLPIKAFATDMPSLTDLKNLKQIMGQDLEGSDAFFPEHYAFLSRDIPNIEGLVNLEAIVNEKNVLFVGFPLKIEDGNGGPMRPAALIY